VTDREVPLEGSLAYIEYQIFMPDRYVGTLAFTLGDLTVDSAPAKFARSHGALAYGLVAALDVPEAPELPMIWTQENQAVTVTSAVEDREITADLKTILGRMIAIFFADIASIAPELGRLKLLPLQAANDH
jgi:hypothetical protein